VFGPGPWHKKYIKAFHHLSSSLTLVIEDGDQGYLRPCFFVIPGSTNRKKVGNQEKDLSESPPLPHLTFQDENSIEFNSKKSFFIAHKTLLIVSERHKAFF